MLVPLYGFMKGDSIGLVLLVHDHDSMRDVGRKLQQAAAVRVAPRPSFRVYRDGRVLAPELTVGQAGFSALERIDVVQEDEP